MLNLLILTLEVDCWLAKLSNGLKVDMQEIVYQARRGTNLTVFLLLVDDDSRWLIIEIVNFIESVFS